MSKVASAAAAMGVGEDQLAAQLSTIISVTKQAPESVGTALRTVYARISDIKAGIDEDGVTLGNYSGKMAELGINVLDMNGNLRDMGEVMEEIGGKWDTLTREQQVYLAQTMAGQRQYNNLLALFDNFDQYNYALETARESAGALQEQQDTYMESTKAHLAQLKASVEDLYDSLINTDSVETLVDTLSTAATMAATFVDSIGGGQAVLKSLGAVGVSVFSQQIAKGINTTITNLQIASSNAEQFAQKLEATRDWQNNPNLSDSASQLLQNREQLLQLARLMSPDQFKEMQGLLNNITSLGSQIDVLTEKTQPLEDLLNRFSNKSLTQVVGNDEEINKVTEGIRKQIEEYQNLAQSVETVKEATVDYVSKLSNGDPGYLYEEATNAANKYKDVLQNLLAEGSLDAHEAKVQQILNLYKSLPDNLNTDSAKEKFNQFFNQLSQLFLNAGTQLQSQAESLTKEFSSPDLTNALEQKKAQLDSFVNSFISGQERMQRAAKIENWAKVAGGIAQVGTSIQQIQHLGSIWKNADLSIGEQLLQTITNLSFSLPMLLGGFTKAATALGLMTVATGEEAAATFAAATANGAHVVSLGALKVAADGANISISLLNTTILLNPFVAAAAAALGLVTALGLVKNAVNEVNQALIEQKQTQIQNQNTKQEQIDKNKELLASLSELDQKYQNGEITRSDLKSAVEDLIDQYGLEGAAADQLAQSYDNLSQYINKARAELAEEAAASARRQNQAAESLVKATAKGKTDDEGDVIGDQFALRVSSGKTNLDEAQQISDLLSQAGGTLEDGDLKFLVDNDVQSIVKLYDSLQDTVDKINEFKAAGKISNEEIDRSEYYQNTIKWLNEMKNAVEAYKESSKDANEASIEELASKNGIDFEGIDNANSYLKERSQLIDEIQAKLNKSKDDAASMADDYLRDNFRDLYNQFNQTANFIEEAKKSIKEATGKDVTLPIEELLSKLDENHLAALLELDPSTIKDWQTLQGIIQQIAGLDLSQTRNSIIANLDEAQSTASDNYNIYQSLEEQVSGGKTISKSEFENLTPEIQQFFSVMANGSYKMTGDAKEFYDTVNSLKLDGFHEVINAIYQELDQVNALASKNFDYNDLDQSAFKAPLVATDGIDYDLVDQQLEYLDIVTDSNSALNTQIQLWQSLADKQALNKEQVDKIAEAIANAGDETQNLSDKSQDLKARAEEVAHQLHDAMFPTDEDVDTEALEALSETIQQIAESSEELADTLSQDSRSAQDVAESILRFDDAIQDVVDNYDDWLDALDSGSIQDQAEVVDDLRDAYADLLDLDGSSLSNDFLTNTQNLELMKAAINGDTEAYDELLSRAGQDIISHLDLDHAQFDADLATVQNELDAMNYQDLEIGANLDTGNFLQACTDLVNNAGMTAQQATDYLASMGVDAEVVQQKTQGTETKQQTGWNSTLVPTTATGTVPIVSGLGDAVSVSSLPITFTTYSSQYEPTTKSVTDTKENSAFSLKVTSANKSSGGGFKFSQASNGGGRKGGSSGGSGGGGGRKGGGGKKGGGGSGSAKKPDTSQKDLKKALEDQRDIYHDINIELDQINRNLDRAQKQQDRLYGKQLLDNLNKQSKILDEHKSKLQEKHELQLQDLKNQEQALKNLGVMFDSYGNISNYLSILGTKQNEINALIKEENSLIQAYNASTDSDIKKQISERITAADKRVKNAEDEYKNLEKKIKNYDDLREDIQDVIDEIEEETQKQIEINIEKFRMDLQIRLDMGQAERDWNEFRRKVLENSDVLKGTDFDEILGDAKQGLADIYSYFNVKGGEGALQALTSQLMDTRAEIQAIDNLGWSAIYGDNKAQAMEDLQNDLDELMEQMQDIQDLIDDIDEAYLDTINDIQDQFDEQIESLEFIGDLIQHDMDLLSLLYGDKNYDAMQNYYNTLQENNLKQLDSLRRQREFWKQEWEAATARGDTQAAKEFEKNYKDTIENLNDLIEDSAKVLQDKYSNAIERIFDTLDKKITNNKGTDYLSTQWDLMNTNAEEYLDTINAAFAVQQTERKYQKALNDTKGIKNQQSLRNLMNQQLSILKNKEKLTEYDIERAEKLLQVEQARIALEDAQSAKTSMRLKRDSQGNYSYEYTADSSSIEQAQQNLATAQNDLYNFDKDRYQSNLDDMLSAWQDFQSDYKDILLDTSLSEEQRIQKLALLREEYGEYINNKTEENLNIRNNLMESAFADMAALYDTDVANYTQMTDEEKAILMGDLVPMWKSGIQEMADSVAGEGGFIGVCETAFEDLTTATKDYEKQLEEMAGIAELNLSDVESGIDNLSYSFSELVQDNEDLIMKMQQEILSIADLQAAAHALVLEYKSVYDAAKLAVTGVQNFIQVQRGSSTSTWTPVTSSRPNASSSGNSSGASSSSTNAASATNSSGASANGATGTAGASKNALAAAAPTSNVTIEGIAGNIWIYGSWGNDPDRHNNMIKKFGKEQGDAIYNAVQAKFANGYGYNGGLEHDWEYYKKYSLSSFRSGGYTGSWGNNGGRLGILHQKELVLNQTDTKNILDTVSIMRSVLSSLNSTVLDRLGNLSSKPRMNLVPSSDALEQKVHIEASFPGVNSKREIEEAFEDLVNLAAQRAMR